MKFFFLKSEVEILKCETKDNSSCEYQMRYKLPDLCNLFLDKNQFYTPFIQSMSPTVKCPLNKVMGNDGFTPRWKTN